MKELKSLTEFQNEGLELERKHLKNISGGLAGELDPIIDNSDGGADSYFYRATGPRNGNSSDRQRCSKQDNPNLPGYGDNGGVHQCVYVS